MTEQNTHTSRCGANPQETNCQEGAARGTGHSVIDVLTQLALRKWLIVKVMSVSILIGLILCFVLPVRYTASTSIMPPKQAPSSTSLMASQMLGGSLAEAASSGLLKDPNAIYIGLLKSRPVADAIIGQFDLVKVYHARDTTAARKRLEKSTQIASEKNTMISISVTDRDKKRAADMANAYTEQLRVLTKTISVTEASRRRHFYEEQLKSQKEALVTAEVAFQQVQQNKGLVEPTEQAKAIIGSLADLRVQIAAKEVQLQALRSYSTEHNSDVQLAEHELSALQAEAAQKEQHGQSGSSDMGLKDIPKAGLDYVRAERELQYQQSLFDLLLKQFEAARLDESKEAASIQVVEPAIAPDRKSAPNPMLIMVLFMFVGFFSACFCAWCVVVVHSDNDIAGALLNLKEVFTS